MTDRKPQKPSITFRSRAAQQGVGTLPISLILLVLMTLITVYAARVGMLETRTAANKVRAEEAFQAAENGIEQGAMYIGRNRGLIDSTDTNGWMNSASTIKWANCTASMTTLPCGDGTQNVYGATWLYISNVGSQTMQPGQGSYTLHLLTPCRDNNSDGTCDSSPARPYNAPPITVMAEGQSADQTGRAVVRQAVYFYAFGGGNGAAPVPMMAPGSIGNGGTFHVVANPDAAGRGVPLSAWSNTNITLDGSATSCQLEEFLATDSTHTTQTDEDGDSIILCPSCTCPNTGTGVLSSGGTENYDILDVDGNVGVNPDSTYFPSDMFEFVFGVPTAQYTIIKSQAQILPDCSTLTTSSSGLYWITGNCHPSGDVGSYAHPVLVVVEGSSKINSNNYMFGALFAFSTNPAATLSVDLNGTPTLYGAILSNANITLSNGNYKMRFDAGVMGNLADDAAGRGLGKVAGSWADFH
jgi:Tfp pilus assembly protein PilX